jgi:hypothetical protein
MLAERLAGTWVGEDDESRCVLEIRPDATARATFIFKLFDDRQIELPGRWQAEGDTLSVLFDSPDPQGLDTPETDVAAVAIVTAGPLMLPLSEADSGVMGIFQKVGGSS